MKIKRLIKFNFLRILANHKHKKAIPLAKFNHIKNKKKIKAGVRPRGGSGQASFRFGSGGNRNMSDQKTQQRGEKPDQQKKAVTATIKTPKLEFGFKPITGKFVKLLTYFNLPI